MSASASLSTLVTKSFAPFWVDSIFSTFSNDLAKSLENVEKIESTQKGANDFVTNVDKEAEALIIDTIKTSYPDHSIVAEEGGFQEGKDSDVQWIIDPLDGTSNFIKGLW